MLDEPQTTGTETLETPATENNQPSQQSEGLSESAPTATPGTSVSDALRSFEGIGRVNTEQPKKVEEKVEEIPTEGEEPSTEPVTTPETPTRPSRDLSGLDEQEAKLFKGMSNAAFAHLKPVYLEHKKLKADFEALKAQNENLSKESFYEHQDAYQLAPEYQQATQNLQIVDREVTFWKQQLAAIRNGAKWTALVGYDKDGRPQLVPDQEPTPEAEADILGAMQNAFAIKGELSNKISGLKTTFSQQHKNYLNGVASVEKEIFKGVDQETLNKAMAKKITIFPEHRRNVPEVKIIAKLLAVLDGYQLMLDEKKAAAVTAEAKTKTAINGGPTNGRLNPAMSKGNTVDSVIKEFNDAKAKGVW